MSGLQNRNLRLKVYQVTEFNGIRRGTPESKSVAGDLHLAFDTKVSYFRLKKLKRRNLRLKLYQNTEFDGIQRGPPKSESVAGDIHLALDAKVEVPSTPSCRFKRTSPS